MDVEGAVAAMAALTEQVSAVLMAWLHGLLPH